MNLKELAQTLGLSPTTVSRALNGYPEVAESTRLRIESAARRYNYQPNARAQRLATGRSMAIAHVLPVSDGHEMVNPIFGDFVSGASETYLQHGYDMMLSLVADGDQEQLYADLASKASVDGLIISSPRRDDERIPLLHRIGLPFVVHGRASFREEDYNWVDVNNRRAFERATGFLIDLGHRQIALINGLETMDFAARRREGYLAALSARGIAGNPDWISSDQMTEQYGYRTTRRLLDQNEAPTAIVASSIIVALGVQRALLETGHVMGRDVSVIAHDDALSYLPNGAEAPIFTAVKSSVKLAGRLCAEMLIDLIKTGGSVPRSRLLEAELVVGGSTGPAPLRPS